MPVVANLQEVVGSLLQSTKVVLEHDIPMEDFAEHFVREFVDFQFRVPLVSGTALRQGISPLFDAIVRGTD